jgi:hypothetical protein
MASMMEEALSISSTDPAEATAGPCLPNQKAYSMDQAFVEPSPRSIGGVGVLLPAAFLGELMLRGELFLLATPDVTRVAPYWIGVTTFA